MIRYLSQLNDADVREELWQVGFARETVAPDVIEDVQNSFAFQVSDSDPRQVNAASDWLRRCGARIYACRENQTRPGFVACAERTRIAAAIASAAPEDAPPFVVALQQFLARISRRAWHFQIPGGELYINEPLVMGILNVTPDSFSDGGQYFSPEAAYARAMEMLDAGATIIDIGGESTRPGAQEVDLAEEWARVAPVLRRLAKTHGCIISIDTYKSEIARRAVAEGAHIINDISGGRFDPAIFAVAAQQNLPMVLMHIQGRPRNMQKNPQYTHLMAEIFADLDEKCRVATEEGVRQLIVDPGIGFGKRYEDNFEILRRVGEFTALGWPVLVGASRKRFLGRLLGGDAPERLLPSVLSAVLAAQHGAMILRVHDVAETGQALTVLRAVQKAKAASTPQQSIG